MRKLLLASLGVLLVSILSITSASALNDRAWVSATGTETVNCYRAFPCRTFQDAMNTVEPGGTITCIDAGDYTYTSVNLTITKSVTIDCAGTLGMHSGLNININGAGIVVHLRNLLIDGAVYSTGAIGVNFINGAALYIEHCTISGFNKAVGQGIRFTPPAGVAAKLVVIDSTIVDNAIASNPESAGIYIAPVGSGIARVSITGTKIVGNQNGVYAVGTGGSTAGFTSVLIKDSYIANSVASGVTLISTPGAANVSATLDHSASGGNGVDGIRAQGSNTYAILTESTVVANLSTGLHSVSGGNIVSYQNNAITGAGNPTAAIALK